LPRDVILRLKCTKFDFGWGSAPDPAGSSQRSPDSLSGFEGVILLRKGKRRGRKGRKGKERKGRRGGRGKEGKGEGCVMAFGGWTPLLIPIYTQSH